MGYLDYYERVEGEVRRIEESEKLVEDARKQLQERLSTGERKSQDNVMWG